MDELLGTEVGNYRLIRVLGEGGMGRVYVGEQEAIASRVAIKVLTTKDPELVARFFAEARAVNVIKHSGLVKVLALSNLPDGRPYIIMELVEGETLRALVERDSPLPIGGVVDVMKQMLGVLAAAHAHGVIHRDLKPDNVMVTPEGQVKVLDFGIAKLSPALAGSTPRTRTGSQIGTPAYMAPEQIRGLDVDARTDLYTAGVVLFEALTGRLPFEAPTEFELMRGHLEIAPPLAATLRADVPSTLDAVLARVLAKRPEDRYATASELAAALEGLPTQKLLARAAVSMRMQLAAIRETEPVGLATVDERPSPRPRNIDPREAVDNAGKRATVEHLRSPPAPRRSVWGTIGLVIAAPALAIAGLVVVLTFMRGAEAPADPPVLIVQSAPISDAKPTGSVPSPANGQLDIQREKDEIVATLAIPPDPATFDPIANITTAQLLARQVVPNVVLADMDIDSLSVDGHIVFDDHNIVHYHFAIPNLSLDQSEGIFCDVAVNVEKSRWLAVSYRGGTCTHSKERIPRCDPREIWQRALKRGAKADEPASLRHWGESWDFVQPTKSGPKWEVDDTCGTTGQGSAASTARAQTVRTGSATSTPPIGTASRSVGGVTVTGTGSATSFDIKRADVISEPVDFDVHHFDMRAYLPKAQALARRMAPAAELYSALFHEVHANGEMDISADTNSTLVFLTPEPENCVMVGINFLKNTVIVTKKLYPDCSKLKFSGDAPKCTIPQVIALAKWTQPSATISYFSHYWSFFDGPTVHDDCK